MPAQTDQPLVCPKCGEAISDIRKVLTDGVHDTSAMRPAKVKNSVKIMLLSPSRPASFITQCGPYKYAIHVEENPETSISNGKLGREVFECKAVAVVRDPEYRSPEVTPFPVQPIRLHRFALRLPGSLRYQGRNGIFVPWQQPTG